MHRAQNSVAVEEPCLGQPHSQPARIWPARLKLSQSAILCALLFAGSGLTIAQVSTLWNAGSRGIGIAVNPLNESYTTDFEQSLGADLTVTKRDAAGNLLWTARFDQTNPTQWERAEWIELDPDGNAIVCGTLMSGIANPTVAASLLLKFSPQGTVLWRQVFDSPFDGSQTRQLLVDRAGSIFVLGLGSGPNGYVTKIRKYSPAGTVLWTYFDPVGIGSPLRMKATTDGGLLVSARSATGSLNGFAKIDAAGQHVWHRVGFSSLAAGDAASDQFGNSYLVNSEFGASGTRMTKVDPQGNTIWEQLFPQSGSRVAIGPDQSPIVSGFPGANLPGAAFFKVSPSGLLLWANPDADGPQALLLHGRLVLDDVGDAYLTAGTLFQMAVCKVRGSDGAGLWTALVSGGGQARGIALSRTASQVFVVGGTTALLLDATAGSWRTEGQSFASTGVAPELKGYGRVAALSGLSFQAKLAPQNAPGVFVIGLSQLPLPFFGNLLVPSQDLLIPTVTDGAGEVRLTGTLGSVVPPGLTLYVQAWFAAPMEPSGLRATNTVSATAL